MLNIREAVKNDINDLYELYMKYLTQCPPEETQDMEKWSEILDVINADPDYHLIVGEIHGKVVSSVTLVIVKNLTHNLRPYSLIENVVTNAEYRNKGYASALIEKAGEIAKGRG